MFQPTRFKVVPAGRRSGKSEIAKRYLLSRAIEPWSDHIPNPVDPSIENPRYFFAAPTWAQARLIFWNDIKSMVPKKYLKHGQKSIRESDLTIELKWSTVSVVGLDKPERIEGAPWDGGILDEYANMKSDVWNLHVRPCLSDRNGWAWFIGVPEGRNHYYTMYEDAKAIATKARGEGRIPEWDGFHWKSADILPASEIEAAKRDLDDLSYMQEYEANFVSFHGKAYYPFNPLVHACTPLEYNPKGDLIFCFDFNVNPGVAVVCQEQPMPGQSQWVERNGQYFQEPLWGTGVIGEVHIPRNSNTPAVCSKLLQDYAEHKGRVICYGDATGGAKGTSQIAGSDWDLVKNVFRNAWDGNVFYRIPHSNPRERVRINSVNSRLQSKSGAVKLMVDPVKAPNLVKDFEGVRLLEGGSGEIDKRYDERITHLCFSAGTMVDTIDGNVPIEELSVTGLIRTFDGSYVPYINPGCRGEKETVCLELSNGESIECTPDHRFLTENGWVEAKDSKGMLLYNKSMYKKEEHSLWRRAKSLFLEKSIRGMDATTAVVVAIQAAYTGLFGNTIMGKFLKDFVSTIKMKTLQIMKYGILNVCHPVTTCGYICQIPIEKNWLGMPYDYPMWKKQQGNGIRAKKEESGTENMGIQQNFMYKDIPIIANFVGRNINPTEPLKQDSAVQDVRWLIEKQTQTIMEFVKDVVRNSQVNTRQSNTVPENVIMKTKRWGIVQLVRIVGKLFHIEDLNHQSTVPESAIIRIVGVKKGKKQKVYCPQVEKVGCFCLANGVVVSNSDACGYYIVYEFPIQSLDAFSREMLI
jgi:hypothetical protein